MPLCISGVGGVALFIEAMVVAFVVLGYLIFAIDRARVQTRPGDHSQGRIVWRYT